MKNTNVKLSGVKTFNKFWFRSCYYHQLYSAVSCLGVNADQVVLGNLRIPYGNFETEKIFKDEKEYLKSVDFSLKHLNVSKNKLLRLLKAGYPVIVGVDCYEMRERENYYHKGHCKHFVMVYGYNTDKELFYITDHNYFNDYMFREKEMTFDELFTANLSYRKFYCSRNGTSSIQVKKCNKHSAQGAFYAILLDEKTMSQSLGLLNDDLNNLKEHLKNNDSGFMLDNIEKIVEFANTMKESFSVIKCLNISEKLILCIEELIACFRFIWGISMKIKIKGKVELKKEEIDKILAKIDILIENVSRFYKYIKIEYNKREKSYGTII